MEAILKDVRAAVSVVDVGGELIRYLFSGTVLGVFDFN